MAGLRSPWWSLLLSRLTLCEKSQFYPDFKVEVFEQKTASQNKASIANRYLFNNPEYMVKNEREAQLHANALNSQEFHQLHTKCSVVISIVKNIDSVVYTKSGDITLREMILSIPSQNNTWGEMALFRSIDFVQDTISVP